MFRSTGRLDAYLEHQRGSSSISERMDTPAAVMTFAEAVAEDLVPSHLSQALMSEKNRTHYRGTFNDGTQILLTVASHWNTGFIE